MGRLMQIHRKSGMASNYDCCFCGCPYNYTPSLNYMNPNSLYLWVASEGGFAFEAGYEDCNRSEYWYDYTTSASWSSGNPSIASMQGAGLVKGVSGGTASISASYSGYTYTFNGSHCIQSSPVPGGGSGPGNVCDFSIAPQTVRSTDCTNGTEQNQTFAATVTPSMSDCDYNSSSSNTYGQVSSSGNVEIDQAKSSCTFTAGPSCTVYYYSGPKRSDGTAGTINMTFSLQLGLYTVVHTQQASVTCP